MLTTVAGDEYAIGYVSLGSLDDSVKALKIDGAEATAENIEKWRLQSIQTVQHRNEKQIWTT